MNMFQRIIRSSKNYSKEEKRSTPLSDYLSYYGVPFSTDQNGITYETALTISSVYKAITLISDSIASLPLEPNTMTDGIFNPDKNHPSYYMLNVEPHPMWSKFNFWKCFVSNIYLHGNAYAYIERNSSGDPKQLLLLSPLDIEMYINEENHSIKYKHKDSVGFIDPTDMIHVILHSSNGYYGRSVIEFGTRSLGISIANDKVAEGFFKNGGNMSGILSFNGRLTPEKAAAIKAAWNTAFSPYNSGTSPGGIAVMEQGMEFSPTSIDPQTAQLLESRKFTPSEVARWFNLPASKLGTEAGQYYNSIEQNNIEFLQTTLTPILERIENELGRKLYRPSQRKEVKAKFQEDAVLRADLDSKVNYLSKSIDAGLMSINEGREKIGLPPVEDGDTIIIKSGNQPLKKLLSEVEQQAPEETESQTDVEQDAPKRQRTKNKRK